MSEKPFPALSYMVTRVTLYSLLGIPLAGFIWESLNKLVAGQYSEVRLLVFVPAALLFALLLRQMAGAVVKWDSRVSS